MPILIDGNNLLHAVQRMTADGGPQIGRSMLCDLVGRWAGPRGERVHVVFDGIAPSPALASQIGHPDITVSYSGPGVSADAVIIGLLNADSAARRLLVVSSDHEIGRAAKRRRARTLGVEGFWSMVQADLRPPPIRPMEPEEKRTGTRPEHVEGWLTRFGVDDHR